MSASSVADFASTLGPSSGPEGTPSSIPETEKSTYELADEVDKFIRVVRENTEPVEIVYEELICQYGPSLVASVVKRKQGHQIAFIYLLIGLLRPQRKFALIRFVREQPEQACALYLSVIEYLADQSLGLEAKLAGNLPIESFCTLFGAFSVLVVMLLRYIPDTTALPRLSPSLITTLQALKILGRDHRLRDRWPSNIASHDHVFMLLKIALKDKVGQEIRSLLSDGRFVWHSCQAQVEAAASSCVEPAEGEMKPCSRCLAVRYCSREHQEADWKTHKLTCFKPSW